MVMGLFLELMIHVRVGMLFPHNSKSFYLCLKLDLDIVVYGGLFPTAHR